MQSIKITLSSTQESKLLESNISIQILSTEKFPMIEPGDDLASIIYNNIIDNNIKIDDGDVIAVAQKVISKAENRYRCLDEITPSEDAKELANQIDKDPQFVQAVLDESAKVLRYRHNVLIVEHKLGFVHANAGIDRSNINQTTNKVLLLPKDPDASAGQIGNFLSDKLKKNISVIVTDTMGRPFRNGIVGFAIGSFNLEVIRDERGKVDLFDNQLKVTQIGVGDELAAAASLVMGQAAEGKPLVVIKNFKGRKPSEENAQVLIRDEEYDLFR